MEQRITASELAKNLSDVLNRVRYRGEHFLVERNGMPVATLSPAIPVVPPITLSEAARRLAGLKMPGEGFADDLEAIQAAQPPLEPPKWPS
jgi:antitoxin (DNA-binding transcriptional repressor) of toxin-antitoxin stability system